MPVATVSTGAERVVSGSKGEKAPGGGGGLGLGCGSEGIVGVVVVVVVDGMTACVEWLWLVEWPWLVRCRC